MALTSVGNYLTLTAVQKMALRLRMELLVHLDQLSANYYESVPPGSVMYPLKEPIDEVSYLNSTVRLMSVNITMVGAEVQKKRVDLFVTHSCPVQGQGKQELHAAGGQ